MLKIIQKIIPRAWFAAVLELCDIMYFCLEKLFPLVFPSSISVKAVLLFSFNILIPVCEENNFKQTLTVLMVRKCSRVRSS